MRCKVLYEREKWSIRSGCLIEGSHRKNIGYSIWIFNAIKGPWCTPAVFSLCFELLPLCKWHPAVAGAAGSVGVGQAGAVVYYLDLSKQIPNSWILNQASKVVFKIFLWTGTTVFLWSNINGFRLYWINVFFVTFACVGTLWSVDCWCKWMRIRSRFSPGRIRDRGRDKRLFPSLSPAHTHITNRTRVPIGDTPQLCRLHKHPQDESCFYTSTKKHNPPSCALLGGG